MSRDLRSRNKSKTSRPRGGGTPLLKKSRAAPSASAAAAPPSLRGLASPRSFWPDCVSFSFSSSLSSPSSSSSPSPYSPSAAAACVCRAYRARSFLAFSRIGSSPPGSSRSGAAYSMGFFCVSLMSKNGTEDKPTNAAAVAAASFPVLAWPVSISSSSTVRPASPFGASAIHPSPRPLRLDCEFVAFISSSSSSPSPYIPSAAALRHKSAPRGGMAISFLHCRSRNTFLPTVAPVTSEPGSFNRTPPPRLIPGVMWCHRQKLSASVTPPLVPFAIAISAPGFANPPAVTKIALSSSKTVSPPASAWCVTRSRKGTSARNFPPVVRFVTHTARARTIPSAHRKSSLVCVPVPVSPGFRAHNPEALKHKSD
mmetsp:Transcript_1986/g.7650  ORF Transcript_1986/g.7650 Transcript_1986/m.7650 type:complete len:369 (+) Transcript_1986:1558-2664(+)